MKACNQLIELSFCVVCALAPSALFTLNADPAATAAPIELVRAIDRESIVGSVTAKSESNLTVDARVVTTASTTACTKDGKPVALADIRVGDKVKVTTAKAGDHSLPAVTIEVMAKPQLPSI